jgi:hypothetical protein
MVQSYYTLQEAAKFLNMNVDELKQMAQRSQIRSFQDRGTLRFRIQDIQELARVRGSSSDDQDAGNASPRHQKPSATPPSGAKKAPASPKTPAKQEGAPQVFDFDVDADSVDLGADLPGPASGSKSKPATKSKKAPTPTGGSDSDVRLVSDGSDVTFSVPKGSDIKVADSDVRISADPLKPKTGVHPPSPSSGSKRSSQVALGSGAQSKSKLGGSSAAAKAASSPRPGGAPQPADSGVRLVPMDDDSDVKLHGADDVQLGEPANLAASDSNVRLEKVGLPPVDLSEGSAHPTEEINLDEEILKHQELEKDKPAPRVKAKSELKLPTTSPFELSETDLELPPGPQAGAGPKTPAKSRGDDSDSSDFDLAAQSPTEKGSSDFDLVPTEDGSILPAATDNDFSLEASDDNEQVLVHEQGAGLTSSTSGISLNNPVDAGISLEEGGDEASDFDLSLEVEDTPKPQPSRPIDDSDSGFDLTSQKTPSKPKKSKTADDSSEFELSIDSDAGAPAAQKPDSSEFEVTLEGQGKSGADDSDGEFELTLDDSGDVAAVEQDPTPQVKSKVKAKKPASGHEQDIFDTDFEVPALEESDDAAVADSELESSDFDLALDDSELAQEEESGSQVVALDEEDAETVVSEDAAVVDDVDVEEESSDFADLDADVQVDDEDAVDVEVEEETATAGKGKRETIIQEKLMPPAPWGVMPVILMLPCVVIMFLVSILGYELVQTSAGLNPPGLLTKALAQTFGGVLLK